MNKNLTIIIPSYKSKKLVLSHVNLLCKKYKIIIIENSYDKSLEKIIKKKFSNVDFYLKKNIGYGRAINFASKYVKTKYFFVMSPDTILYKNTLNNLINTGNKIKKFGMIAPNHIDNKKNNYNENVIEKKQLNGTAMMFQTSVFRKIKGFDEKIFLYYEENDYFTKCNILKLKLFIVTNSFYNHQMSKNNNKVLQLHSSSFKNIDEKNHTLFVGGWHGQWSKFYYKKKYHGFLNALIICLPNILVNIIQLIPAIILNPTKAKYKYFKIEGFICSVIGLTSFRRSKYDKSHY